MIANLAYSQIQDSLRSKPRRWLVTGVAGFIGSNILEELLKLGQTVTGLDDFSTGSKNNLVDVQTAVGAEAWSRFSLKQGDIRDVKTCHEVCNGAELVLHQAALGSVPRSIKDPLTSHSVNVDGFLNMIVAARDAGVQRFVYASTSSVYGDSEKLPKQEDIIGNVLSPYAATKRMNEIYGGVFAKAYDFPSVGLRYFNVFGARQDKTSQYAAVIPLWIYALMAGSPAVIFGDGSNSRDFCYVQNVVEANIRAALSHASDIGKSCFFNIGGGRATKLTQLYDIIRKEYISYFAKPDPGNPSFTALRPGDVLHSLADISKAAKLLGYRPAFTTEEGLKKAIEWYASH